jgi:transposase
MKKTCGLDVHKDSVFCGIYNGKHHSEVETFNTTTVSIRSMGAMLKAQGVKQIAIESTGTYWIPVWNILEEMDFQLMLVNPYLIKQMPGRKSDVKDAQWIATLLHKGLLRPSLVPCKQIRELRVYSRRYMKFQQKQTTVLQQMERTLEMCGIRITSYVSNISGKSIIKVIEHVSRGQGDVEVLTNLIHGRIVKKHGKQLIKDALTGFIPRQHRFTLKQLLEEYQLLVRQSDDCLLMMEELCCEHYAKQMNLLITIPGISQIAAMIILAETGADMQAFENSSRFAGWTGLRPRNDESAGKYKSTATTKGNRHLRVILAQVAWGASRTKGSYFQEKFARLAMRKPRKKALIAIARKIAVLIWNVLYYQEGYNPEKLIVYSPVKLQAKMDYHQREFDKLSKLIKT